MAFLSQLLPAWRRLWRSPAFALLSILTLAVGIGANTAVWSVVDAVLLSPLPYPQSDRLVGLWHTAPGLGLDELPQSPGTYLFYRKASRALAQVALYDEARVNLTGGDTPERLSAARVTASLFQVLRVSPRKGRAFTEDEERPGAAPVVILSDGLWKRRFGADPGIVGRPVRIDGVESVVVGVMPAGFDFPSEQVELWIPQRIDTVNPDLGSFGISGVGRLATGESVASLQRELDRLLSDLSAAFPGEEAAPVLGKAGFAPRVRPLADDVAGDVGNTLWILLGAVGFILLIACANVANLLLVRGEARRRETAIQLSLGVPRGRLMGAVLAESLVVGVAAGVVGLVLAWVGIDLLVRHQPIRLPRVTEIGIDGRVLAFTAALSLLTSLLFGLLPALRGAASIDLASELKGGGRAVTAGRSRRLVRRLLVALQVALALVLLTGSGLMLQSFANLVRIDPGFDAGEVLTLQLALPEADYPDDVSAARFFQGLVDRLAGLAGAEAVGAVSSLPLGGSASASGLSFEEFPLAPGAPPPVIGFEFVTDGYFKAMGIPLKEGRLLTRADQEDRTGNVLVSESLARRFWPDGRALGKRLRAGLDEGSASPWYTIVGVVGDVRNRRLTEKPGEIVYYPTLGKVAGAWTVRQMSVVLRTPNPGSLIQPVRGVVREAAPNLPVANLEPMENLIRRERARQSFTVLLFAVASAVALLLGGVGIYAFVSYMVGQRTPEIGVRMAIGADPSAIRRMVQKEALALAAAGIAAGLLGSFALTRWLRAILFEVSPLDPLVFTAVPLLLVTLVLLASYPPASRAARVDPQVSLARYE